MDPHFYWWQGIVAGAGAVVAMTIFMSMGRMMGMTDMDLPVILGSMLTPDRRAARALGLMMHVVNGLIFGVIYAVIWWALGIDRFTIGSAWWVGLIFGVIQGILVLFMMPMVSIMHPRVRTSIAAAGLSGAEPSLGGGGTGTGVATRAPSESRAQTDEVTLPAFGFGGSGFGKGTPMGILIAHLVFGGVWAVIFAALI